MPRCLRRTLILAILPVIASSASGADPVPPPPAPGPPHTADAPGWVLVRVIEQGTGGPVVDAQITRPDYRGRWGSEEVPDETDGVRTGESGTAFVGPVSAGDFITFRVDHAAHVWDMVNRLIDPVQAGAGHPEIVIEVAPGLPIAGVLVDEEGKPGRGKLTARVLQVTTASAHLVDMECTLDFDGSFRFPPLPLAKYELTFNPKEHHFPAEDRFIVTAGQVDLRLKHAPLDPGARWFSPQPKQVPGEIEFKVLGPDGAPVKR